MASRTAKKTAAPTPAKKAAAAPTRRDERNVGCWFSYREDEDGNLVETGAPYPGEQAARRSLDTLPWGWRVVRVVEFGTNVADAVAKARADRGQLELPSEITDPITRAGRS